MLQTSTLEAKVADLCEADVRRAEAEHALASANRKNASLMKGRKGIQDRGKARLARLKVNKMEEGKTTEEKHKAEAKNTEEKHKAEVELLQSEVKATKEKAGVLTAQVIALEEELQEAKAVRLF